MKKLNSTSIRRTTLCVAMAIAVSIPGIATAGLLDKAKNRAQTAKARVSSTVTQVRQERPLATTLQNIGPNLPDLEIIEIVKELNLKEQLLNTIALMREIQADYQYFSGGTGCEAECAEFREELKGVFGDFLSLVREVPVLSADGALVDNLERALRVIDYIPPRALYPMWQLISGQLEQIRIAAGSMLQDLDSLPPLEDDGDISRSTQSTGNTTDAGLCEWLDDKPFVDLVQARLEMFAWKLKTAADLIPDVGAEATAGAAAGVAAGAAAEGNAEATVSFKPSDHPKIVLKVIAIIPERINWAIKINRLRAEVGCKIAGH
jgi:hypothetical protein